MCYFSATRKVLDFRGTLLKIFKSRETDVYMLSAKERRATEISRTLRSVVLRHYFSAKPQGVLYQSDHQSVCEHRIRRNSLYSISRG